MRVILGAGGFGREVWQYLLDCAPQGQQTGTEVTPSSPQSTTSLAPTSAMAATAASSPTPDIAFLDDNPRALDGFAGYPAIAGPLSDIQTWAHRGAQFVIAFGAPATRANVARRVAEAGGTLASVIHPTAYVAPTASLSPGVIICPFALVAGDATVRANAVLNIYASVGHDASLGAHSTMAPYATLNGFAQVGERVLLGSHVTVANGARVGAGATVSAGSLVKTDVAPGALAAGNPARSRVISRGPDVDGGGHA